MKKIITIFFLFLSVITHIAAQEFPLPFPEVKEERTADTSKGVSGKNFIYLYMGLGMIVGKSEGMGSDILYGHSTNFAMGLRFFHHFNKFYRMGVDLGHDGYSYRLKQDSTKILPNNQLHNRERIVINNLNVTFVNRLTIGKATKGMGTFIDVGGFAGWTHTSINFTQNDHIIANAANATKTQTYHRGLVFVEDYQYGITAGFGRNFFRIVAKYRLSDNFKSQFIYSELPRITVGLELGLHP
ncbi:MAG: hypothetical protein HND27_08415 [Bacteroidetes bacterium]|nr:hypothetical protein [Bacteroidota bacterium]MBV6460367.1 hypothetical protein [Flavobacteriales bacterium]WKZ74735.1 MAG: hypothetical protein QY303_11360 [Vicingaceae bacterium]MCL4815765.1 hypothetical protein [Flavobacteriales bacterium]NOG95789.1 hypothetical protein [Bacteroidota bacterium]